jgi:sugar phosphate isomerase/epimerase
MKKNVCRTSRRDFMKSLAIGTGAALLPGRSIINGPTSQDYENLSKKLSLNAYSFDKPLKAGTMSLDKLIEYCSKMGFDAVDLTGYYFTGYPAVPSDEVIYKVKKSAFLNGIEICGTGVRNDFTWADPENRKTEKQLVKDWIIVASKLGAPQIRIFAGNHNEGDFSWEERARWIADEIIECAEFGKNHGVMIALQNHNDFLKTSDHVEQIMKMIDSDWVGLMLDIGSYHTPDPYADIATNVRHAISWQLKEKVFVNETQVDTDYVKVITIIKQAGYKGYLPLETLGEGDPEIKVADLLKRVRSVLGS